MRTGQTQNRIGSNTFSGAGALAHESDTVSGHQQMVLLSARLAALVFGALVLGVVFAFYPLRGVAVTRLDVLAVGAVVLAQGAAYAAIATSLARLAPLAPLMVVPLLALAQLSPAVLSALGALALIEIVFMLALVQNRNHALLPLAALIVPCVAALGVFASSWGVFAAGLVWAATPLVCLVLRAKAPAPQAQTVQHAPRPAQAALLLAALAPEGRQMLVSDAMGLLDAAYDVAAGAAVAEERFPGGSLVEAALIADRVALLHALSKAAREGVPSAAVEVRLREGHLGAGYPVPPRFGRFVIRALPLPGVAGRAAVLIEPVSDAPGHVPVSAQSAPGANPALLAKALHDGMAPFNAGLGFLEMVADPCLAPRDFTALHDFSAEAHKAMSEAHRNTVLLGQWLRLTQDEAHARARTQASPRRLLTEALRLMNLEDIEKRGDLVADATLDNGLCYLVPIHATRFALSVLLRFGMGAMHLDLSLAQAGDDLVFSLARTEGGEQHHGGADAFQQALEQAATNAGTMIFEASGAGVRRLRLVGAAQTQRLATTIRLAS